MAELLIKVDEGSNYTDGDCLVAISDRRIQQVHAEHICNPARAQRTKSGMLLAGSPTWHLQRVTRQYRNVRLSKSEFVRIDQWTGERQRFGPPDIDLRLYLKRRRAKPSHSLFFDGETVVWFSGRTDVSQGRIDAIWNRVEQTTPFRRSQAKFRLWGFSLFEVRHHLAIRTESITEKQVQDFTEPLYRTNDNGEFAWRLGKEIGFSPTIDDPPDNRNDWRLIVARKRRRRIAWRELVAELGETEERIRDLSQIVGHRVSDEDGIRYTSKTQPLQNLTRIRKKGAITR